MKVQGNVKMFNKEKGYGFIHCDNGDDVFFHYSSLVGEGYKTASSGERVEFEIKDSPRGPRAENISRLK